MTRRRRPTAAIIAAASGCLLFSSPAASEDQVYHGAKGSGLTPCPQFLEQIDEDASFDSISSWIHGLWTGMNMMARMSGLPQFDVFATSAQKDALRADLKKHCDDNPSSTVVDGALKLFFELPKLPRDTTGR